MADLLRLSSTRLPETANLNAIQANGLFTHYSAMNQDRLDRGLSVAKSNLNELPFEAAIYSEQAEKLYAGLANHWSHNRFENLVSDASDYLAKHRMTSLRELNPEVQFAVSLCDSWQSFQNGGFQEALGILPKTEELFDNIVKPDLGTLSNAILCGAILGIEPERLDTQMAWWRSIAAIVLSYHSANKNSPNETTQAIAKHIFEASIHLPKWFFTLRGCTGPKSEKELAEEARSELQGGLVKYQRSIEKYEKDYLAKSRQSPSELVNNCQCNCDPKCLPVNPRCICVTPFVTNYYLLKDQLHCYVPADLAHIEVVAAGETKKRVHEFKELVETQVETETNIVQKEDRDLQVTDRSTIHTEIEKQMQASLDVSAKVDGKYGTNITYSLNSDAKLSKSSAEKATRDVFREAVSKAAYSMQKTTRTLRKERRQTESTEKNIHSFINETPAPFITKYFYVTQQRKAQVYDYGMKLIVELIIPSPAALFEALWEQRSAYKVAPPAEPCQPVVTIKLPNKQSTNSEEKLVTLDTLTEDNYLSLGSCVGESSLEPPPKSKTMTLSSTGSNVDRDSFQEKIDFEVPAGYKIKNFKVSGHFEKKVVPGHSSVDFRLGNDVIVWEEKSGSDDLVDMTKDVDLTTTLTGSCTVIVDAERMDEWNASIILTFEPTDELKSQWKVSVFQKIMTAYHLSMDQYRKEKEEYDKAKAEHDEKWESRLQNRHPFYNRETAHVEIKRSSIFMMCQSFDDIEGINWMAEPCGLPELDRQKAKYFGKEAYFWDRAFDWDLMSYILFDYFWNPMCKWQENFDIDHNDAMFRAFLQAGYARVHVPVAEGMEEDVEWYLLTGQKWGQTGKPPLDASDKRWRSIAAELKLQRGCRQDDRPGRIDLNLQTTNNVISMVDPRKVVIRDTNYYLNVSGAIDQSVVDYDIDREIFIDFVQYRIMGLKPVANLNGVVDNKNWEVELDRDYEGKLNKTPFHAVGARFVGAPFLFEVPTDLVWATADDTCLPCYPVECHK